MLLWVKLLSAERRNPDLPPQVLPGNPEYLSFMYHVRRFNSLNYRPSRDCRSRPLHGAQPPFDVPVVGFDPVIAIPAGSLTAATPHVSLGL